MAELATPLVSVITPCRNAAQTLEATLSSIVAVAQVLEASGRQLEHWVVDGGSSDGTAALVHSHQQHHLWCFWLPDHCGGPYAGMSAGLTKARGHYVHVLNADDFVVDPKAYAQALLSAHTQRAAFVLSSIVYVRRPALLALSRWQVRSLPADAQSWHKQLRRGLHYPHPGFIAQRDRYLRQGFDCAFRYAADYLAMQAMLLVADPSEVLLVQQPLVAMSLGGSTDTWRGRWGGRAELQQINRRLGIEAPLWRRYTMKLLRRVALMWREVTQH
jgi:glycosyltransferase involved in cell wall biosynthesis